VYDGGDGGAPRLCGRSFRRFQPVLYRRVRRGECLFWILFGISAGLSGRIVHQPSAVDAALVVRVQGSAVQALCGHTKSTLISGSRLPARRTATAAGIGLSLCLRLKLRTIWRSAKKIAVRGKNSLGAALSTSRWTTTKWQNRSSRRFPPRPEVAREGIGLSAPAFQIRLGSEPSGLESVDMMDS
jgi:hypothetical protein